MSNGSTIVIQNCQVTKSNKIYTLRESLKGSTKDGMRLHELSCLLERYSQSVFLTKKITKEGKNVMSITQFSWFKTFCIALLDTKPTFYCISRRNLHPSAFHNSCTISGYKCIDFSLYVSFQNPMSYLLSLGWVTLLKSQPLAFLYGWALGY